jgi:hypothetical protein
MFRGKDASDGRTPRKFVRRRTQLRKKRAEHGRSVSRQQARRLRDGALEIDRRRSRGARVALEFVAHQVAVLRRRRRSGPASGAWRPRRCRSGRADAARLPRPRQNRCRSSRGSERLVAHMHDARGLLPARLSLRLSKLFLDVLRQEARHVQDLPTVTRRCSGEGLWRPPVKKKRCVAAICGQSDTFDRIVAAPDAILK